MTNQFVTYEIALALKELRFDELCLAVFYQGKFMHGHIEPYVWNLVNSVKTNSDCNSIDIVTAPLYQQVIDWFRDEHLLELLVLPQDKSLCDPAPLYFIAIESYKSGNMIEVFNSTVEPMLHYDCYYEAREGVILKCIEIIKENKL
jgi:hypothetical protein